MRHLPDRFSVAFLSIGLLLWSAGIYAGVDLLTSKQGEKRACYLPESRQ